MTTFKNDEIIAAEAENWFFRLRAEDVSAEDRAGFAQWLAAGAAHAQAWAETQILFGATARPAAEVHRRLRRGNLLPSPPQRLRPRTWMTACLGGMVLVLMVAMHGRHLLDDAFADASTAVGERRAIALDDGSTIEMNTDSALDINLDGPQRRIRLRRGEAFFQVVHDPRRPFIVETDQGAVAVMGTRFSVGMHGGHTTVAVEDGIVEVSARKAPAWPERLVKDQQVRFDAGAVSPPQALDRTAAFAWRHGQVVFRQQSLSALVAELNRYWPGRVVILNQALAQRRVSGVFEVDRRESSLTALAALLGAQVTQITPYLLVLY